MICLGDSVNYTCEIKDSSSNSLTLRVLLPLTGTLLARRYNIHSDLNTISELSNNIMVVLEHFNLTEMRIRAFLFLMNRDDKIATLTGATLECIGDFNSASVAINTVGKCTRNVYMRELMGQKQRNRSSELGVAFFGAP